MNNPNKSLAYLLIAMIFTACATSQTAPSFSAAPTPVVDGDYAVLYIFRIYAQPTAWPAYLQIDGQEVVSLNQEGFTWVKVKAGPHKFKHGWPALAGMPAVNFEHTLVAGTTYAFQMHGTSAIDGLETQMQNVEIEVATKQMAACCRYVPPKVKN
jgi:hypothetical protein